MNKVKKRAPEQTTPMLILEDHELRLRYIENYINDEGDSLFKKNSKGLSSTKKRVSEQMTPLLILEDHEVRLRNIESYIKDGHINIRQYETKDIDYQKDEFSDDDIEESDQYISSSIAASQPFHQFVQKNKSILQNKKVADVSVSSKPNKKDVDAISSTKPDDFKNEITLILSRIGELLNQMR
jgi:hypothetical protein